MRYIVSICEHGYRWRSACPRCGSTRTTNTVSVGAPNEIVSTVERMKSAAEGAHRYIYSDAGDACSCGWQSIPAVTNHDWLAHLQAVSAPSERATNSATSGIEQRDIRPDTERADNAGFTATSSCESDGTGET